MKNALLMESEAAPLSGERRPHRAFSAETVAHPGFRRARWIRTGMALLARIVSGRIERKPYTLYMLLRHFTVRRFLNLLLGLREKRAKAVRLRSRPHGIYVDVSGACNLRCPFCTTGQGEIAGKGEQPERFRGAGERTRGKGLMRREDLYRIVDQLHRDAFSISFHLQGEPTVHKHLDDMIRYAKRRNLFTSFSTNMTLLDRPKIARLLDAGIDYVVMSVDGTTQETYETYRRGGDLSRVLENMRTFVELRARRGTVTPFLEWQFVLFRHNEHQAEEARRMAGEIGIDFFTTRVGYVEDPSWLTTRGGPDAPPPFTDRILPCHQMWETAIVNWDGRVGNCCQPRLPADDFGNLHEESFDAIWNNPTYRASRRLFSLTARRFRDYPDKDSFCYQCLAANGKTGLDLRSLPLTTIQYWKTRGSPVPSPRAGTGGALTPDS